MVYAGHNCDYIYEKLNIFAEWDQMGFLQHKFHQNPLWLVVNSKLRFRGCQITKL